MEDIKISIVTCDKPKTALEIKQEIQERLRSKEIVKARQLLSMAMTHMEALQITTKLVTKQVLNGKSRKS